jgi:signal transduction histidine kinase
VIEEEQRWRAALMATLAHDVRSPLATIQGLLEFIADDADLPGHLEPLVAAAARQASRLSTLASTLLDLERVEGGKLILDWQDVDIEELLQQVAELLGGTDVSVEVESGLTVRADPMRLQQMMVNLDANPESVGLGLWIVRLLAQAHGGDAVHRPADPGSEFVITLPGHSILPAARLPAGADARASGADHAVPGPV